MRIKLNYSEKQAYSPWLRPSLGFQRPELKWSSCECNIINDFRNLNHLLNSSPNLIIVHPPLISSGKRLLRWLKSYLCNCYYKLGKDLDTKSVKSCTMAFAEGVCPAVGYKTLKVMVETAEISYSRSYFNINFNPCCTPLEFF